MAETLRELVVALSLEKAVSRAICAARNQRIREAESTFRSCETGWRRSAG